MEIFDLFISYRRLDAQRVRPLVDCLRRLGIEVWIDESEIEIYFVVTASIKEVLATATPEDLFVGSTPVVFGMNAAAWA